MTTTTAPRYTITYTTKNFETGDTRDWELEVSVYDIDREYDALLRRNDIIELSPRP